MYVSVTKPERDQFFQQSVDCFMPGYTGHCPTLKFRIGKRYGACTKEIIKEMSEKGLWARHISSQRNQTDPFKGLLNNGREFRVVERSKGQNSHKCGLDRARPYVLGYTGFIPGLNFTFGKSYARAADESRSQFEMKRKSAVFEDSRKATGNHYRNRERKFQKLQPTYPEDKLGAALFDIEQKYKYHDDHVSSGRPPIAGYTGHIPRMKSNETSLSQRYHTAAQRGLYILQQERERYKDHPYYNKMAGNVPASIPRPVLPLTTPVY